MLVMSALGAGIVKLTSTSTFTELHQDSYQQARYLAESGLMYAISDPDVQRRQHAKYAIDENNYFQVWTPPTPWGTQVTVQSTVHANSPLQKASFRFCGKDGAMGGAVGELAIYPFASMDADEIQELLDYDEIRSWDKNQWGAVVDEIDPSNPIQVTVLGNTSTTGSDGQAIFIPLPDLCDQYIIRSIARLGTSATNMGGYGIFYDTTLDAGTLEDPGYRFLFDRGYGTEGALQLRRKNPDQQLHVETAVGNPDLPTKTEDPTWWTELHLVELMVVNTGIDNRRVYVTVHDLPSGYVYSTRTLNDFSADGPWIERLSFNAIYPYIFTGADLYTGFRTWAANSFFHYLEIEMICDYVDVGNGNGGDVTPEDPGYYVSYSGGAGEFAIPSGGIIDGSVYGESVNVSPNARISGNIISKTSVSLGSGVTVGGFVCAPDGDVELKSSNVTVTGNIHAWGNIILNSGATADSNVYATENVILHSSASSVTKDIHAGNDVSIRSRCLAKQNVFAGGSLEMRNSDSEIWNNAHIGGDVTLDNNTSIFGSVWAGGTINRPGNVSGTPNENQPVPPRILPTPPIECPEVPKPQMQSFTAGDAPTPSTDPIPPGSYQALVQASNGTRTLVAGNCQNVGDPGCYYFTSISGGGNLARLRLDLSTSGDIVVFVTGDIRYSGPVEISTDGSTWTDVRNLDLETAKELARRVYWETHGDFEITSSAGTAGRQWFGTVLARNDIDLPSGPRIIGSLATIDGSVSSQANVHITYVLADFARRHW